ncbi:hypothetical protein [Streptomyces stelliscabiei]|uniref:hypothetical protein n=1 Tax=Streptomyces stelliscabiei TaxID=146820 RepID=UPI0029A4E918|nr:hypothetical protein [Streptomyces stelliscabiei]MDX3435752.1 hypothetical protein [Streptomyces stelliscabiei]MDX3621949.1 hypothetical protein [Streptomyces stelliscabiei]
MRQPNVLTDLDVAGTTKSAMKKLPEITPTFWIMKIAVGDAGESAGPISTAPDARLLPHLEPVPTVAVPRAAVDACRSGPSGCAAVMRTAFVATAAVCVLQWSLNAAQRALRLDSIPEREVIGEAANGVSPGSARSAGATR